MSQPNCDFVDEEFRDGARPRWRIRCVHCGRVLWSTSPAAQTYAVCSPSGPLPPLFDRIAHFATALAAHAADGFAKRSEAEIAAILETHCAPCDKFDGSHCTVCGCNCSGSREFLNKIAWASEHCPHPDGAKW